MRVSSLAKQVVTKGSIVVSEADTAASAFSLVEASPAIKAAGGGIRFGKALGIGGLVLAAVGAGVWAYANRNEWIHPDDIKPESAEEKTQRILQQQAEQLARQLDIQVSHAYLLVGLDFQGNLPGKMIESPRANAFNIRASAEPTQNISVDLLHLTDEDVEHLYKTASHRIARGENSAEEQHTLITLIRILDPETSVARLAVSKFQALTAEQESHLQVLAREEHPIWELQQVLDYAVRTGNESRIIEAIRLMISHPNLDKKALDKLKFHASLVVRHRTVAALFSSGRANLAELWKNQSTKIFEALQSNNEGLQVVAWRFFLLFARNLPQREAQGLHLIYSFVDRNSKGRLRNELELYQREATQKEVLERAGGFR